MRDGRRGLHCIGMAHHHSLDGVDGGGGGVMAWGRRSRKESYLASGSPVDRVPSPVLLVLVRGRSSGWSGVGVG